MIMCFTWYHILRTAERSGQGERERGKGLVKVYANEPGTNANEFELRNFCLIDI